MTEVHQTEDTTEAATRAEIDTLPHAAVAERSPLKDGDASSRIYLRVAAGRYDSLPLPRPFWPVLVDFLPGVWILRCGVACLVLLPSGCLVDG